LDLGSSGFKAIALGPDGAVVASSTVATPFYPVATGASMTFERMLLAIRSCVEGLGIEPHRIDAIGVASMAESGAILDHRGTVVTEIPAWYDERGSGFVAEATNRFGAKFSARTGRHLRAKSSLALAAALRVAQPNGAHWLGVAELALYALTTVRASEPSLAARSCAYDIIAGCYIPELLDAARLPAHFFAPVLRAGTMMGETGTIFSRAMGLRDGVAVTIAGHDHPVAASVVSESDRETVDSMGTAEQIVRYSAELPNVSALLARGLETAPAPNEGWAITASRRRPGVALRTISEWLEVERTTLEDGESVSIGEALSVEETADVADVVAGGPVTKLSESMKSRPQAVWTAALELLARDAADLMETMDELVGAPTAIVAIGGGTRSRQWMTIKRRLASVPLRISNVDNATARGAALAALRARGAWS
jgi:xylulokinase